MEKPQATVNNVFAKNIYQGSVENFEKLNKEIIPHIESFVKEKPGRVAATTDVRGNTQYTDLEEAKDNLHIDEKYKKIFNEIGKHIKIFLQVRGYNENKFDAHIIKAWATYTAKDQYIESHKHTASHFSLIYYVRAEEMGGVRFEEELASQTGLFIPPTDEYITKWNQINYASYLLEAKNGNIVIFPSILLHQTEINKKNVARISLSADVLLTMKKGIKTEHCIPHPEGWLTI